MANQKHLAILKQGVDVWNKWRQEHPDIQPNLMEADLEGVDLSGIDLSSTNLTGVNLTGANLTHAILTSAIMHSISWKRANDARDSQFTLSSLCLEHSSPGEKGETLSPEEWQSNHQLLSQIDNASRVLQADLSSDGSAGGI